MPIRTGSSGVSMSETTIYEKKHPIRIVTSAALFDGHDAAVNIMRRILQATGVEVIHLGHNRSVEEVVNAAIQEDAQGVAVTSYQGGHMEFFRYMREMLDDRGAEHIKIYGGGGGVIVPREIEQLHESGIDHIFSPEDGRRMGLQGMINEVVRGCDFDLANTPVSPNGTALSLARRITVAELQGTNGDHPQATSNPVPTIGITGPGGAGKSSLTDELIRRFLHDFPDKKVAVLSVDPTKSKTGGALLGDRIRFNTLKNPRVFMRSIATRGARGEISEHLKDVIGVVRQSGFDIIFVETAGIGQGDRAITDLVDLTIYVMTSEYGAPSQLEKIEMLDYADIVVINKFTRQGSEDALRDVRKQIQRNKKLFDTPADELMVFGTSAAHFNDHGVNQLYGHVMKTVVERCGLNWQSSYVAGADRVTDTSHHIIPPQRERYLSEIAEACREYRTWARQQAEVASELDALRRAIVVLGGPNNAERTRFSDDAIKRAGVGQGDLMTAFNQQLARLDDGPAKLLRDWKQWQSRYEEDTFAYSVRGKEIQVANFRTTLSGTKVPKVALPRYRDMGDRLYWRLTENVPGEFPYTAGVFPFKRSAEDPTRMFAGEGTSDRTNRRFHLLADGQPAKRLSTAFDSITLYGEDPDRRPDIYGKVGESGVSVFTVEEAERLYAGFDLCDPATSVSMTINGPAPTVLAFFFNTAIRQRCRLFLRNEGRLDISEEQVYQPDASRNADWSDVRALLTDAEYEQIRSRTLSSARGTVQADILKEDQGQNTCIFSTDFSLKLMGDVQQYFIDQAVRNFYSVSISGYHIAEAGANPIHQLAFTLANGFTYLEYYHARGMDIDSFAPSLSFFFSNGMDIEYSVIGRVARRIWAVALNRKYGAADRSQMLKYHIQTSGRSLHAQEIEFNDIRTTLQALLAVFDNAQSLHTNAYDEAITTPTEQSVRRAMAIQLIINQEFGLTFCENATQGSFVIEELTDLVEDAVLAEFDRITSRGGVLGAMERQYQRGAIQDDSLNYEQLKHSGGLPLIGVNTFLSSRADEAPIAAETELTRASQEEKELCIARLKSYQERHSEQSDAALHKLKKVAVDGGNIFAELMNAAECCSLGQITNALYEVGGEYRRNL